MPNPPSRDPWPAILELCHNRFPDQDVRVWLDPLTFVSFHDDRLVLAAPSIHHRTYVNDFHQHQLTEATTAYFGRPIHIDVQTSTSPSVNGVSSRPESPTVPVRRIQSSGIDSTRTFDNFVVGKCNEFAHAASVGVASRESPYNPLLIYAPTGYGKTHLLSAIGNRIEQRIDGARVLYVTSESFVNEMIRAIQDRAMPEFRAKYRSSCDVLLVDDIQFLSGKERTQEEFFHTFNTLITSGKSIVLTSDVEPQNIPGLEERLRTRFAMGLIADIHAPDVETMCAILGVKAKDQHVELPSDVAHAIARHVGGSIREAEGTIKKLCALHAFHRAPITLEFLREHLSGLFTKPVRTITAEAVIEATARYHGLKPHDLTGNRKTRRLSMPRQIAMYLARELTDQSFPDLGKAFGGRDHSTVQYGCKKINKERKTNADLAHKIQLIRDGLLGDS